MLESNICEKHIRTPPFNLQWIHGYNPKVAPINLTRDERIVFYAATNCGVLYNCDTNKMTVLQGHSNFVTCIATDIAGKWLVTADSGLDNVLTVWDHHHAPCRTIFNPHGSLKTSKVSLSGDAKYLLTIAYHDKAVLYWWIWSFGLEVPHAIIEIEMPRDAVLVMEFNPDNSEQFVLMSKHDVWVGATVKVEINEKDRVAGEDDFYFQLKVMKLEKDLAPDIGTFTTFASVGRTSQIMVATSAGAVVVFGYTLERNYNTDTTNIENIKFVKALKLDKYKINVIKFIDNIIVTGNQHGEIKFYDDQLKLLYWCHRIKVDCIRELSFNLQPKSYVVLDTKCRQYCKCCDKVDSNRNPQENRQKLVKAMIPSDATSSDKPFLFRDFIVQSDKQGIGYADFVHERLTTILNFNKSHVTALSVHPQNPYLCLGFANGSLKIVNYETHKVFAGTNLRDRFKIVIPPKEDSINSTYDIRVPALSVTCLQYSPSGIHLACGLNDGGLVFLDPITIQLVTDTPFHNTKSIITHISYSCDSFTIAIADKARTVAVYRYNCQANVWNYLGKHRVHAKDISVLTFTNIKIQDSYRLFSFGLDRSMVEYGMKERLEVLRVNKVDQTAVPLCGIDWATPNGMDGFPAILIGDDEHKYKILNCDTATNMGTFLGPRFEDPVHRMTAVTKLKDSDKCQYLIFATKKNIGIQKLPLDGNPYKHIGLLCHPKKIICADFIEDIDTLFSLGEKDNCVFQWKANYSSVEKTSNLGGSELNPYYCLIEGGKTGWLFQEIRDLFYYIQVLCEGTFAADTRRVGDHIPVESLPDIMRALGYFPSQFEVKNMLTHAKYNVYSTTPNSVIEFEDFVKLYLNHRPAFGDNIGKIWKAFKEFANFRQGILVIGRDRFVNMLCEEGEKMTKEQAWYLLSILCGHSFEERGTMTEGDFSFLPEEISFADFTSTILGLQDVESSSDQLSGDSSQLVGSVVSLD